MGFVLSSPSTAPVKDIGHSSKLGQIDTKVSQNSFPHFTGLFQHILM